MRHLESTYVDDGGDKVGNILHLLLVVVKVGELACLRCISDNRSTFANRAQ